MAVMNASGNQSPEWTIVEAIFFSWVKSHAIFHKDNLNPAQSAS